MAVSTAERVETESPKRQAILNAAETLFIAQGYGPVSMEVVAREANVSKATLYAHFESKARLFATIVTETCQAKFNWHEIVSDIALQPRDALMLMGRRALRFVLEERALAIHRIVIAESLRFPEIGQAFFDGACRTLRQRFGTWLMCETQAGRLRVADPALAADQWISLLRSGAHFRAILGVPPPPSEAEIENTVAAAVDVFLAAYGVAGRS